MQFGGRETAEREEDADPVCFFLLAEENDGACGEDFFAEVEEVAEAFVLASGPKTYELLRQRRDRLIGVIDEEADWAVEA